MSYEKTYRLTAQKLEELKIITNFDFNALCEGKRVIREEEENVVAGMRAMAFMALGYSTAATCILFMTPPLAFLWALFVAVTSSYYFGEAAKIGVVNLKLAKQLGLNPVEDEMFVDKIRQALQEDEIDSLPGPPQTVTCEDPKTGQTKIAKFYVRPEQPLFYRSIKAPAP